MSAKKVFISYSHDSELHKQWVCDLATYLRESGIEVIFDQWNVELGDDNAAFMEDGVRNTDRVLIICTDAYVNKANLGVGGVGYEKTICTAEIIRNCQNRRRFIPIVRDVKGTDKIPTFLGAAKYLDLSEGKDCPESRKKLVESICNSPPMNSVLQVPTLNPKHALSHEEPNESLQLPPLGQATIVEFSKRFAQAFPGLRGVQWIDEPQVIAERLGILLSQPLIYKEGKLAWWWRGYENLRIDKFEQVEGRHFQMDNCELNIRRIAAVNRSNAYNRKFVYVETCADSPTGLYPTGYETQEVEEFGYCCEEYGLVDGNLPITFAEYEDGATVIDDTVVNVIGRVVPRIRYVTPYNFLIAPPSSPINNSQFDYKLQTFLNQMLQEKDFFSEMCNAINALPKLN